MSRKIIPPKPLSLVAILVLSFYANEYNLGVAKTLEVLRRKDTLPQPILVK